MNEQQPVIETVVPKARRVVVTARDEAVMEWLRLVRIAPVDALRWALPGFAGRDQPVSIRAAQQWVERMLAGGYIKRWRMSRADYSVISPSWAGGLDRAPSPFRPLTRHELAVASASARFIAAGWTWEVDPRHGQENHHIADGVVTDRHGNLAFIEVELTPKSRPAYNKIRSKYSYRLDKNEGAAIFYLGDKSSLAAVETHMRKGLVEELAHRVLLIDSFNIRGSWLGTWSPPPALNLPQGDLPSRGVTDNAGGLF